MNKTVSVFINPGDKWTFRKAGDTWYVSIGDPFDDVTLYFRETSLSEFLDQLKEVV